MTNDVAGAKISRATRVSANHEEADKNAGVSGGRAPQKISMGVGLNAELRVTPSDAPDVLATRIRQRSRNA